MPFPLLGLTLPNSVTQGDITLSVVSTDDTLRSVVVNIQRANALDLYTVDVRIPVIELGQPALTLPMIRHYVLKAAAEVRWNAGQRANSGDDV